MAISIPSPPPLFLPSPFSNSRPPSSSSSSYSSHCRASLSPPKLNLPTPTLLSPPSSSLQPHLPNSLLPPEANPFSRDRPPTLFPPHHLLRLAVDRNDLRLGRAIHAAITKTSCEETIILNCLISVYIKLGCLSDAQKVFDGLPSPDVASFASLISAYAKCDQELKAVGLFYRMRLLGIEPNEYSFVAIFTNCIRQEDWEFGSQVHAFTVKTGHVSCIHVGNALVGMYAKCGHASAAEQVFAEMTQPDVSSWNSVISGIIKDGRYDSVFRHFKHMLLDGINGDGFTISTILTAAAAGDLHVEGEAVHAYALKAGLELDLSVGNSLIGFYTRLGFANDIVSVFQGMPVKDVISWTAMISGYMEFGLVESAVGIFCCMPEKNNVAYDALLAGFSQNGEGSQALQFFKQILLNGIEISDFTLTTVLNACTVVSDIKISKQIHAFLLKVGSKFNACTEAALIDMYAKSGRIEEAEKLLNIWSHDEYLPVAWNSLICAHVMSGQPSEAFYVFKRMLREYGTIIVDAFTIATILGISGTLGFGGMGKQVHGFVVKYGLKSDIAVGNAILSMYAKCERLGDAIRFFDQMLRRDKVTWNALINAHLLNRQGERALDLFDNMISSGVEPDAVTFLLIISACRYTSSNSIGTCHRLFSLMERSYNIQPAEEHYAAMVDVLGYWGSFEEIEKLLESMTMKPGTLVWRSLLKTCRLRSNQSLGRQAMQHLLALEPQDTSTFVLTSNLYSASGRWHCSERVRKEMREKGLFKRPAQSWTVHQNTVHSFYTRDKSHPGTKDIYSGLDILILECMKAGYEPDTSYVLHEVEEYQKRYFLFYHSAKLAAMYGLLMAEPGRTVRVVKNIHLCGDCHMFLKYVSSVSGREITVRDPSGFHIFKAGKCSCGDYW